MGGEGLDGALGDAAEVEGRRRVVRGAGHVQPAEGQVAAVEAGRELGGAVLDEVRPVPGVDPVAELEEAAITVSGGEGVVVLVHREEHADAEVVVVVELLHDVRLGASGEAVRRREETVEEVRDLDAEDDRELALLDHRAGLGGRLHDAEPPLPGAAGVSVDVALEGAGLLDLPIDGHHVVARVADGLGPRADDDLTERGIARPVLDHEAEPAHPRPLDPLVVLRLVRRAVAGVGPVGELGVAGGVVVELRQTPGDHRRDERVGIVFAAGVVAEAQEIAAALGPVEDVAVRQRVLDAESVKGRAVEDAAAPEAEVREHVLVGVDDAEERPVVPVRRGDGTLGVDGQLGELGAPLRRVEGDDAGGLGIAHHAVPREEAVGPEMAELEALLVVRRDLDDPLGVGDVRVVYREDVGEQGVGPKQSAVVARREIAPFRVVEEIRGEVGGLHEEARALLRRSGGERETLGVVGGREPAGVVAPRIGGVQGVAALGVAVDAFALRRGRPGHRRLDGRLHGRGARRHEQKKDEPVHDSS